MKAFGLIALLLGLAAAGFAARQALLPSGGAGSATAPKQTLDDVRARAAAIEREQQKQADELEKKAADSR